MIILLHGALGSAHQFAGLSSALHRVPHQILEFPGHGQTDDIAAPWTIELFSQWLQTRLQEFESPVTVFGYSMGGYVAMDCALRNPQLCRRIVTLGTKLRWSVEGANHETKMLDPDRILEKVPRFAEDLQRRHGADRWRTVLEKTASLMHTLGAAPVLTTERMLQCTTPIRFGLGDRDEMVSLDETREFFAATPGAEFFVLPATKHPIEKVRQDYLVPMILG